MFNKIYEQSNSKEKRFVRKRSTLNSKQFSRSLSSGNFRGSQSESKFFVRTKELSFPYQKNQFLKLERSNEQEKILKSNMQVTQRNTRVSKEYFYQQRGQEIQKLKKQIEQLKQKNTKLINRIAKLEKAKAKDIKPRGQQQFYQQLYNLRKNKQQLQSYVNQLLEQNYRQNQEYKKLMIEIDILHRKIAEKNNINQKKSNDKNNELILKQKYFSILESYKELNKQYIKLTLKLKKYEQKTIQPTNQISLDFSQSSLFSKNQQKLQF